MDGSLGIYKELKTDFLRESYLNSSLPFRFLRIVARTRCETTPFLVHQYVDDKICRFCNKDIQTVSHLLFSCSLHFFPKKDPNLNNCVMLPQSELNFSYC